MTRTRLKNVFNDICDVLYIFFEVTSTWNHKNLTIKRFYYFWIKLLRLWQAIARLWITLFLQEFSTLTGVDTLRNMLVIFRKTSFPFNITLNLIPTLHWNQAQFFIKYLCITNFTQQFFSWILKILIADRRKAQTDRINNDSNIV